MHDPTRYFQRQVALDELRGLEYFQSVAWLESIDSTNKSLAQSVRLNSIELPALLIADRQTAGVGRGNNSWWSPSGCLMFSMAVPMVHHFEPDGAPESGQTVSAMLPLRVGYVVAECLDAISGESPLVKWPNDVYIASKKTCGILIEVVTGAVNPVAIIGVGINCHVDFVDCPPELKANATSLHEWVSADELERASPENVMVQFAHHWIEAERRQSSDPDWLHRNWTKRSMLDRMWVEVKHAAGIAQGLCLGIQSNGALRIQNERLEVIEVLAGTVQAFRPLASLSETARME